MTNIDIAKYLLEKKKIVDSAILKYFTHKNPLFQIMYYSVDGGKRIRPILSIASFESCGGSDIDTILPIACGLEFIHTYSLIHDDLPAIDNDDLRRGKASAHKKFGEARAILSGDGLFAYAFELFTEGNGLIREKFAAIKAVSEIIGPKGIVYGQTLDIDEKKTLSPKVLREIHLNKTAKFIAVSVKVGAIMAQSPKNTIDMLYNAGLCLGMLFQYTDDILDVIGEKDKIGKTPGKDIVSGKLTAPSIYGLDGTRFRAQRYAELAKAKFSTLGKNFEIFHALTDFVLNRTY
ncbi:MAG: polyprenyl synthetase family protein [candidate division WOR-3 bacterium]|nr:MAG: polyprenyl synthetase family protein [candidate division WOR-3 bacterium]